MRPQRGITDMPGAPDLYTYQDLAARLKVCARTAAKMVRLAGCRVFQLGNTIRIPADQVERLIQEHTRRRTPIRRAPRPSVHPSPDTRTARNRP